MDTAIELLTELEPALDGLDELAKTELEATDCFELEAIEDFELEAIEDFGLEAIGDTSDES